jgi:hypothetical protein
MPLGNDAIFEILLVHVLMVLSALNWIKGICCLSLLICGTIYDREYGSHCQLHGQPYEGE